MPEPSAKFVDLINEQYMRIIERARSTFPEAELQVSYGGQDWTAMIAVGPPRRFDRWAHGDGPTLERAVSALEDALGLSRWGR